MHIKLSNLLLDRFTVSHATAIWHTAGLDLPLQILIHGLEFLDLC